MSHDKKKQLSQVDLLKKMIKEDKLKVRNLLEIRRMITDLLRDAVVDEVCKR